MLYALVTSLALAVAPFASSQSPPTQPPAQPPANARPAQAKPAPGTAPAAGQTKGGLPVRQPQPPPGPVKAEPTLLNFGIVGPGAKVEGKVTLTNTLDRPVKIKSATPSCQCTGVEIAGKEIAPGGVLEFPISIRMSRAPVKKFADLKILFEGIDQLIRIDLEAEVALPIRATPGFIDVQQSQKQPMSGTFQIAAADGKPFSVLAVHGKPPVFEGFTPGTDAPRASYVLRYDFTEAISSGKPNAVPPYVVVETDRADCPVVDIRVRHESTRIQPRMHVSEYRSSVGQIAKGGSGEFELEIEKMGSQRVTGVRSLWSGAQVELVEQTADDHGNVLIKVKVTPPASFTGLLFFQVEISAGATSTPHLVVGSVR